MTNVRAYTDKELLDKIKTVDGYTNTPTNYYMIFVRSNEDAPDKFDDKVYLFKGKKFIDVTSCTTNSGTYGLLNFFKWNKKGAAMLKANQVYYNCWQQGWHKKRMRAWVQTAGRVIVSRDNDKNLKSEDFGNYETGYFGINIHTVTYRLSDIVLKLIGKWGVGCQVFNDTKTYRRWLKKTERQTYMSAFVLDEW